MIVVVANGVLCDSSQQVSLDNRGFAYGDGVFETLRFVNGDLPLLDLHLERLASACNRLAIPFSNVQLNSSLDTLQSALCDAPFGVVKIMMSRGGASRGCYLPDNPSADIFLSYKSIPHPEISRSVELVVSEYPLPHSFAPEGLKHMSRLEYIQAAIALGRPVSADQELLLTSQRGFVVETMHHNVFLVSNGVVRTPRLNNGGVSGIMRRVVMEIASEQGAGVEVVELSLCELMSADAVFITNAVQGVVSVSVLNGKEFKNFDYVRQLQQKLQRKYQFYES